MPYKDKEQQRAAQRRSHEKLRSERRIADRVRKDEIKRQVQEKKNVPCVDCGVRYPYYVMQFDHVRGIKENDVSKFVANRQLKKALQEIEKCDVVCANCHMERTFQRILKGENNPMWVA